jgi:hypothetical protein
MANLLFGQTSGGHDVLWFQERLGGSAANSDRSDEKYKAFPVEIWATPLVTPGSQHRFCHFWQYNEPSLPFTVSTSEGF